MHFKIAYKKILLHSHYHLQFRFQTSNFSLDLKAFVKVKQGLFLIKRRKLLDLLYHKGILQIILFCFIYSQTPPK